MCVFINRDGIVFLHLFTALFAKSLILAFNTTFQKLFLDLLHSLFIFLSKTFHFSPSLRAIFLSSGTKTTLPPFNRVKVSLNR
jgi:hypothetical protein